MKYRVDRYLQDTYDDTPDKFSIDPFLGESSLYATGGASFSCTIAEIAPAPVQSAQGRIVFPCSIAQAGPAPSQGVTAKIVFAASIAETDPKPVEAMTGKMVFPAALAEVAPVPAEALTAELLAPSCTIAEIAPPPGEAIAATISAPASQASTGARRGRIRFTPGVYVPIPPSIVVARIRESSPAPMQAGRADALPPIFIAQVEEYAPLPTQAAGIALWKRYELEILEFLLLEAA